MGKVVTRYGLTSGKAKRRTRAFVDLLARHGAAPTLATPGRIVRRYPAFMRQLQDAGVEFAVHGFDHVDFRSLSPEASAQQFALAASAYTASGIRYSGFRCPYLSFSHDMAAGVPRGMFRYSSNEAVWWDVAEPRAVDGHNVLFTRLSDFYRATPADGRVVLPRRVGELVELPVSLPDDLQLLDGLEAGDAGVRDAWLELLRRSHERGELFVVLVHPESFHECAGALGALLAAASATKPPVWTARLAEIAEWWSELATFSVHLAGRSISFGCSDRATVLVRGLDVPEATKPWYGNYRVLDGRTLEFTGPERPFVGAAEGVAEETVSFLRSLGFVVEHGPGASACSVYLDEAAVSSATDERELIEAIETTDAPLVRFWQWPGETMSALAVTGDLDALSLLDYALRLVTL